VACPDKVAAVLVTDYFFFSALNEMPNHIATLRMRSGLRFHDPSRLL